MRFEENRLGSRTASAIAAPLRMTQCPPFVRVQNISGNPRSCRERNASNTSSPGSAGSYMLKSWPKAGGTWSGDRKSVVWGKGVSVSEDLGGRRNSRKHNKPKTHQQ